MAIISAGKRIALRLYPVRGTWQGVPFFTLFSIVVCTRSVHGIELCCLIEPMRRSIWNRVYHYSSQLACGPGPVPSWTGRTMGVDVPNIFQRDYPLVKWSMVVDQWSTIKINQFFIRNSGDRHVISVKIFLAPMSIMTYLYSYLTCLRDRLCT